MKRLLEVSLYVGVGLVFAAAMLGLGAYAARTGQDLDPGKWLGFGLVTAVVLADAVRVLRGDPDRRRWTLVIAFFAIQCAVGIAVLTRLERVPAIAWVIFLPLDYWAFEACLRLSSRSGE